jgi:hypothetical protein
MLRGMAQKYKIENPSTEISSLSERLSIKINSLLSSQEPQQTRHIITKQMLNENLPQKLDDMIAADIQAETKIDSPLDQRVSVLESRFSRLNFATDFKFN